MIKRRRMNCSLPKELRRRFNIAWKMLPSLTQIALSNYIWRVRSASTLQHHQIRFPNGCERSSEIDGKGWCVPDIEARTVYVCYSQQLELDDEPQAIAVILHELAHALMYAEDESWWTENRIDSQDEMAAWAQVVNWAARNVYKPSNGGYARANEIIEYGLASAVIEWEEWLGLTHLPRPVRQIDFFDAVNKLMKNLTDSSSTTKVGN